LLQTKSTCKGPASFKSHLYCMETVTAFKNSSELLSGTSWAANQMEFNLNHDG